MKINNLLSFFAPKDTKFFPLLNETAAILVDSSILLERLFTTENKEEQLELCKQIKNDEVKGDKVTGRISKALNSTFITPFDREDIQELTNELDDSIDIINRAAQKVILYAPERLTDCIAELAHIVKKACQTVQSAIGELENIKKTDVAIRTHCKQIKKYEEKADAVYGEGIMNLFQEKMGVTELIKLKEITQELEKATNKINSVGKVLKTILVKYA